MDSQHGWTESRILKNSSGDVVHYVATRGDYTLFGAYLLDDPDHMTWMLRSEWPGWRVFIDDHTTNDPPFEKANALIAAMEL